MVYVVKIYVDGVIHMLDTRLAPQFGQEWPLGLYIDNMWVLADGRDGDDINDKATQVLDDGVLGNINVDVRLRGNVVLYKPGWTYVDVRALWDRLGGWGSSENDPDGANESSDSSISLD
jgi:hypothetical protein